MFTKTEDSDPRSMNIDVRPLVHVKPILLLLLLLLLLLPFPPLKQYGFNMLQHISDQEYSSKDIP